MNAGFFLLGLLLDQAEEFAAGRRVFAELTQHHRSDHRRILLLHTAHHHAHVLGLDHHGHAQGAGHLQYRVGDLAAEVFLDLQAARVHVDNPRHLRQAQHFAARDIRNMGLADKRQQVMFAQRVELDVLDQHHFAVVGAEQGTVGDFFECLFIAAAEVLHRLGGALWRVKQALAGDVLAELAEDRGVVLFQCHRTVSVWVSERYGVCLYQCEALFQRG